MRYEHDHEHEREFFDAKHSRRARAQIIAALAAAELPQAGEVTPATDARFGDYQTNAALILAKQRGENPRALAQKIIDASRRRGTLRAADDRRRRLHQLHAPHRKPSRENRRSCSHDERLGVARADQPKTDRHRLQLAERRQADARRPHPQHRPRRRARAHRASSSATTSSATITSATGARSSGWSSGAGRTCSTAPPSTRDPIAELVRIYKETNERGTADPASRESSARKSWSSCRRGEPENYAIWKECVDLSVRRIRARLSSCSTSVTTSSAARVSTTIGSPRVVERLLEAGIAEISEGAVCVFFRDIPELADKPCIIRKSDGGYNYATTDIATVDYRIEDLKRDTIWIVIGAPQQLHFRQIFEIARREGYTADFRHITFGSILGEDRKLMKTRSGENVAAARRARRSDRARPQDRRREEPRSRAKRRRSQIARKIGIGAVKYCRSLAVPDDRLHLLLGPDALVPGQHRALSAKRLRPHSLDLPQRAATSLRTPERATGPWLQLLTLTEPAEMILAKRLCQFAEIVPTILNDFRPNILANYLFELANSFHAFYEACPVLKSDEPTRSSRLALCELTARILQRGLDLLGIEVPERM